MKVSVAQMVSSSDVDENIQASINLAERAISEDSDLIVYPEYQLYLPDYSDRAGAFKAAKSLHEGISSLVKDLKIPSMINYPEVSGDSIYNTSSLVKDGKIVWSYRKTHLFDAFEYSESNIYARGNNLPSVYSFGNASISSIICYDLRFPELARIIAGNGAQIMIVQAGWFRGQLKTTQWRIMLRSRAIENGLFVLGSAQGGPEFTGHSMVVHPNGSVLTECGKGEHLLNCEIDISESFEYRKKSHVLSARRTDIYEVKEKQ